MTETDLHLIEAMARRRSVPVSRLGNPGPDATTLAAMLESALRVPDHGRLEPWRIRIMTGDHRIAAGRAMADLAEQRDGPLSPDARDKELTRFSRAPVVVIVASKPVEHPRIPQWEQFLSAGAVCMNLLYAAQAHGFGAAWITNWFSDLPQGRSILGLSPDERIAGLVHIGSFEGEIPDRPRPDLSAIVSSYDGPFTGNS
jgi:nitroreductase